MEARTSVEQRGSRLRAGGGGLRHLGNDVTQRSDETIDRINYAVDAVKTHSRSVTVLASSTLPVLTVVAGSMSTT